MVNVGFLAGNINCGAADFSDAALARARCEARAQALCRTIAKSSAADATSMIAVIGAPRAMSNSMRPCGPMSGETPADIEIIAARTLVNVAH
jgi:hypothetical protein